MGVNKPKSTPARTAADNKAGPADAVGNPHHRSSEKNSGVGAKPTKTIISVGCAGKPVCRYIKSTQEAFAGKHLWQEIMRRMFRAGTVTTDGLLKSLPGLEVNASYSLERLLEALPTFEVELKKNALAVCMTTHAHPVFPRAVKASCYYYELHALWIGDQCQQYEGRHVETEWIGMHDALPYFELDFPLPANCRYAVLLLKVRAGRARKTVDSFPAMGMRIVGVFSK